MRKLHTEREGREGLRVGWTHLFAGPGFLVVSLDDASSSPEEASLVPEEEEAPFPRLVLPPSGEAPLFPFAFGAKRPFISLSIRPSLPLKFSG